MINADYIYCPACRAELRKLKANDMESERRPYALGFLCVNSLCPIGPVFLTPKFSVKDADPYGEQAKALRQLQERIGDDAALLEDLSGSGQRPPDFSVPRQPPPGPWNIPHYPPWLAYLRRNIEERRRRRDGEQ